MPHRPGWPPQPPNDDDAHTIGALMSRSRLIKDGAPFLEIECIDGTRVWVTPGMGTSYPDAGKPDEQVAVERHVRELEREIELLRGRLSEDRRSPNDPYYGSGLGPPPFFGRFGRPTYGPADGAP